MSPILLFIAFVNTQAIATPASEGCALRMSETGSMITLQGVVDPKYWPSGSYEINIESRQGGNRSLSRQAGRFDGNNAKTADGSLVLSTTKMYISEGGRLTVILQIEDGDRNQSCSFDYER